MTCQQGILLVEYLERPAVTERAYRCWLTHLRIDSCGHTHGIHAHLQGDLSFLQFLGIYIDCTLFYKLLSRVFKEAYLSLSIIYMLSTAKNKKFKNVFVRKY